MQCKKNTLHRPLKSWKNTVIQVCSLSFLSFYEEKNCLQGKTLGFLSQFFSTNSLGILRLLYKQLYFLKKILHRALYTTQSCGSGKFFGSGQLVADPVNQSDPVNWSRIRSISRIRNFCSSNTVDAEGTNLVAEEQGHLRSPACYSTEIGFLNTWGTCRAGHRVHFSASWTPCEIPAQ